MQYATQHGGRLAASVEQRCHFNVCRCTVALYSFGVKSLGNVNNPVCWAIIPETESADVLKGLWKAVQDAVIMIIRDVKRCDDICGCDAFEMVTNLLARPKIQR